MKHIYAVAKNPNNKNHSKSISEIVEIVKNKSLSPTEFRYICSQVRINCKLVIPKRPKSLPNYLTASEMYLFLEKAHKKDNLTGLLAEFLTFTGLRIAEATDLMVQDIDFDANQLKVINGKGGKDRFVPVTSNILQKIKLHLNKRTKGYVFGKKNGTQYSKRAFQKRIKGVLLSCNFTKNLSTHSLRHTFACVCLARGLDLKQISILLGHDSVKSTEIYAKLELGTIKEQFLHLMDKR